MPKLLRELKTFYKNNKRDFPWRHTTDPYKILVSEVMLQQTQAARIVPFYKAFLNKFPTARALARAKLSDVLRAWQGLGYNRRARYLQDAARIIAKEKYTGQRLPGVGAYTRGAILAFAYNRPEVFIETNIRTVLFHSGILKNTGIDSKISDAQLLPLVKKLLKQSKMQPRDFYSAMMDYGAHLKRQGVKLNTRSKHYNKQSKFEGSARQRRAAKLRKLLKIGATDAQLQKLLNA